jgi:predicted ATPase
MRRLLLNDFRCFAGPFDIPLAPLTVLVGENSSGKSSLLAAIRIAWDLGRRPPPDFNEDPFLLGTYEQIATYRAGRAGRARSFSIGAEDVFRPVPRRDASAEVVRVEAHFNEQGAQPHLFKSSIVSGGIEVAGQVSEDGVALTVKTPSGVRPIPADELPPSARFSTHSIALMDDYLLRWLAAKRRPEGRLPTPDDELYLVEDLLQRVRFSGGARPYAFAPVRSRPQRTYDPIKDSPDPEGQHVPMVLARTLRDVGPRGQSLKDSLVAFGEASGLFHDLKVRRLGKEGDPFQLLVKSFGTNRNLVDVGYGISQILPILVEIFTGPRDRVFLIQQPEVHLHPRAQAALATLFGELAAARQCQLIVETHSDYFIDRLRMDTRDGFGAKSEDISLLYLEPDKSGTKIHPLKFDARGDLIDVPSHYRRFFLEEERRFLGLP